MSTIRPLLTSLNASSRYKFLPSQFSVDYCVVGAGVVGLAIAQRLVEKWGPQGRSVVLVERNSLVGQETSSRNSEVIHAGLYYPSESLKTRLCLRGRQLLYARCETHSVPHKKLGKLVVGTSSQLPYLESLQAHCESLHSLYPHNYPPTTLLTGVEAHEHEPDLAPEIECALWSPETGIVDSHSLMEGLEREVGESESGDVVLSTRVVRVDPAGEQGEAGGWVVQMLTEGEREPDALHARTLINCTGLSSALILNSLLGRNASSVSLVPLFFAKGSYVSYRGPGVSHVRSLLYPCPELGGKGHGHAGLGTHLTLDLSGNVRFGPDVEWLEPPSSLEGEEGADFWKAHLTPSEERIDSMHEAIVNYLPGVRKEGLQADYVGIRPKLVGPGAGFQDFVVRSDWSEGQEESGGRMVSLMGIESPGLTSSLGLAEMVVEDVLGEAGR